MEQQLTTRNKFRVMVIFRTGFAKTVKVYEVQ